MTITSMAYDPRAWGRNLENQAIRMWASKTNDPYIRLDDFAKADAIFLPHLSVDIMVGELPQPYFLEVHGRKTPLSNAPIQQVGIKSRIYEAVLALHKLTRMEIVWLVVGPDAILSLSLPAKIDDVEDHRVYFDAAKFDKLETEENRMFFDGSF